MLVCQLFPEGIAREEAWGGDLADAIEGNIAIADHAENKPERKAMSDLEKLGAGLRELLKLVNASAHDCNVRRLYGVK